MSIFTKVDSHGVKEIKLLWKGVLALLVFFALNYGGGYALFYFEDGYGIDSFWDAEWTVFNTITTIGYGDFSASTWQGRWTTKIIFFIGAVNIGAMIGIGQSAMGSDKSIQNRELRTMLSELLRKNEALEAHLEMCTAVVPSAHHLDVVFEQHEYNSNQLRDGYLTIGKDSSGMYMMSVVAYDRETDQQYHRWIPASSRNELTTMRDRYLEKDDEL
ncbi:cAMP-dependent Kef-type K+ transporter [Vibrio phage D148]